MQKKNNIYKNKAAFGRGQRGTYLRTDAYERKCGKAEVAQYSQ